MADEVRGETEIPSPVKCFITEGGITRIEGSKVLDLCFFFNLLLLHLSVEN